MSSERLFLIKVDEVLNILTADGSGDEEDIVLDEEDQSFLQGDVESVGQEVIIEKPQVGHKTKSINCQKSTENKECTSTAKDIRVVRPTKPTSLDQPSTSKNNKIQSVPKPTSKQSASRSKTGTKKSKPELVFDWKKSNTTNSIMTPNNVGLPYNKIKIDFQNADDPLEVFEKAIGFDELVNNIVHQTNLYMKQKGEVFETNSEEMKAFLGMNLVMGYHVLPSIRDYWSTQPDLQVPFISNIMPRLRFEKIRSALHFVDNSTVDTSDKNFDRAYKIRPVVDHLNFHYQQSRNVSEKQSIDEHMVKFKGHNTMKQYIKNKPVKWGFKVWCRCDSETGYLYQFDIYTGRKAMPERGLGEGVILQLTENVADMGIKFFFDNFFNSPKLQLELLQRNIFACGTVRSDRQEMPKTFLPDKEMKRGDIDFFSSKGVSCVKWMDNRSVLMASNFIDPTEKVTVERRASGTNEKIRIDCPTMISEYNKFMGGVDLMDQLKVTYEVDRRSKIKYYLRLFFDLFDIAVNNCCIIYTQVNDENSKKVSPLEYRQMVARGLVGAYTSRKRAAPLSTISKRPKPCPTPKPEHVIKKANLRRRCVHCAKRNIENRTNSICEICNVHLCFNNSRNCFEEFHL